MGIPIRVAHVMGKMVGGGVEQVVMNYYRHIDRSRVQFDFLVDSDSTLVPRGEIESLGGRVFEVPPYQSPVAYQRALVSLFREQSWKIVHSHINTLSVFPLRAARRAGVPVCIAHSHSAFGRGKGEGARNIAKVLLRQFSNVYPTYCMACSRRAGEWMFGKNADFEILNNAIDLNRFSYDEGTRASMRSHLRLNDNQLVVLHVGRLVPVKNHRFLIDIFAEVVERGLDAVLFLVGDGELRSEIANLAAERGLSGRVMFLGQRIDIERFYMAADALCLPSLYEGLPVVSVEAQATGLPCLLSDHITREVDVTGTVRFLPIDNPGAWADVLCRVVPGRRNPSRRSVFSDYDIERAAKRLAARYIWLYEGACE